MLVRLYSAAVNGLDVKTVEVEVNISKNGIVFMNGMGDFTSILRKIDLKSVKNC